MAAQDPPIVVVGAGLAGLRACEGLRARGFGGRIVLAGDEVHLPYDRPPLSKQFLVGDWSEDQLRLASADRLAALQLDLRLGEQGRAHALDVAGRTVQLATGERLGYEAVVLATGSSARRIAGVSELAGAYVLRTLDDARGLAAVLRRRGARLLLVGAGFIGLEVAASARRLGAEVTVVETLDVPLGRVLGAALGRVCEEMHREEGVGFELGSGLAAVEADGPGLVCTTARGTRIEVDALVVGIGAAPATGWLEGSGLEAGPNGVACDAALVAGERVVVAGDLARWPLRGEGGSVRVEHRTNAAEQGDHAAASVMAMLGGVTPEPFRTVPYVWSDQYDVKIQVLGLPQPDDEVRVLEETRDGRRFVALLGRRGYLSAVVGFGRPRAVMKLRSLVEHHAPLEEAAAHPIG